MASHGRGAPSALGWLSLAPGARPKERDTRRHRALVLGRGIALTGIQDGEGVSTGGVRVVPRPGPKGKLVWFTPPSTVKSTLYSQW